MRRVRDGNQDPEARGVDKEEPPNRNGPTPSGEDYSPVEKNEDADYFSDDNFNLPVSLALFILVLYMIIGCFVYIK